MHFPLLVLSWQMSSIILLLLVLVLKTIVSFHQILSFWNTEIIHFLLIYSPRPNICTMPGCMIMKIIITTYLKFVLGIYYKPFIMNNLTNSVLLNPGLDSCNELGISLCLYQSPNHRNSQMTLPKCHFLLKRLYWWYSTISSSASLQSQFAPPRVCHIPKSWTT